MTTTPFESKLDDLREMYALFDEIRNSKTKDALVYKFHVELDYMVEQMETLYYDTIKNRKKWIVPKLNKERHDTIMQTQKTMQVFMPYMLAYNVMTSGAGSGAEESLCQESSMG